MRIGNEWRNGEERIKGDRNGLGVAYIRRIDALNNVTISDYNIKSFMDHPPVWCTVR